METALAKIIPQHRPMTYHRPLHWVEKDLFLHQEWYQGCESG